MSTAVLMIVAVAVLGAAGGLALDRRRAAATAAGAARTRENEEIRRNPFNWVAVQAAIHQAGMAVLNGALTAVRARLQRVAEALAGTPPPEWTGGALLIRLLALVLVAVLFVLGVVLNIGIFTALIGTTTVVAVVFGIVASLVELLLALVVGDQLHNRVAGSGAWWGRLCGALAALAIVLVMVWTYAPARSAHAMESQIATLQQQAEDARHPVDGSSPDPAVAAAADAQVAGEQARLDRAETADRTQAVLVPAVEVLGFERACEGALALLALRRKHRLEREQRELRDEELDLTQRIDQADVQASVPVYLRLLEAGVPDIPGTLAAAAARSPASPAGLPPAAAPGPPSTPPSPPLPSPAPPSTPPPSTPPPSTPPPSTPPPPPPGPPSFVPPPAAGGIDPAGLHGWSDAGGWDERR